MVILLHMFTRGIQIQGLFRRSWKHFFCICLLVSFTSTQAHAQLSSTWGWDRDAEIRQAQLLGKSSGNSSLLIRPIAQQSKRNLDTSFLVGDSLVDKPMRALSTKTFTYGLMPIVWETKYNGNRPYGWNDAGMIMARGWQTQLGAGVYAKAGPLTIRLRPEFVWAANIAYDTSKYFGTIPEKPYQQVFPGQSSIMLNMAGLGLGISSENIWWGPGQFSSLLLSNNAPGFPHLKLQTNRPIKTPIGALEWQLIAGRLSEDTSRPFENAYLQLARPKNDWRYLNCFIITWQPSFLKNIYLGAAASQQLYGTDLTNSEEGFLRKYLQVFSPPSAVDNANSAAVATDGQFTMMLRWLMPKHQMEWYIEYGYNDYKQNFRDLAANANHASAYIIGFKKLIDLPDQAILDVSSEITQMAQTTSNMLRNAGNWYEHGGVAQGLTHQGQILGAGSGMGNNVQTLQLTRIKGLDRVGFKLQRIQQDPKGMFGPDNNMRMREWAWTDISIGIMGQRRWKNFLAAAELQWVSARNYAWKPENKTNLFFTSRIAYFF